MSKRTSWRTERARCAWRLLDAASPRQWSEGGSLPRYRRHGLWRSARPTTRLRSVQSPERALSSRVRGGVGVRRADIPCQRPRAHRGLSPVAVVCVEDYTERAQRGLSSQKRAVFETLRIPPQSGITIVDEGVVGGGWLRLCGSVEGHSSPALGTGAVACGRLDDQVDDTEDRRRRPIRAGGFTTEIGSETESAVVWPTR